MWAADVFFQNYCLKTGVRRQETGSRGQRAARNGGAASPYYEPAKEQKGRIAKKAILPLAS